MTDHHDEYLRVLAETGNSMHAMISLRTRFGLSSYEAKQVMLQAEGISESLDQQRLADDLDLLTTVEDLYECEASYRESVFVSVSGDNGEKWEGEVLVYDLHGHRNISTCFAFTVLIASNSHKTHIVPQLPPTSTPEEAVKECFQAGYVMRIGP